MRWVAVAFLFASSLAGCSEPANVAGAHDDALINDEDGNSTIPDVTNLPPIPTLDVDILNGTAPLNVSFNLQAMDPDDDPMTWGLDVDGDAAADYNGTMLPAVVNHTFAAEGAFNVTFSVSDGIADSRSVLTINVTGGADVGVPVGAQPAITFTGTLTGSSEAAANQHVHTFDLVMAPPTKMTVRTTWGPVNGVGDVDVYLDDPSGAEAGRGTQFNTPVATPLTTTTESFEVTNAERLRNLGTWSVTVVGYLTAQTSYTVTVTFE